MRNKRGITLIALVLTIIVLLVLVGIFLSLVLGDNGVLNKAQNATIETKNAEEKERVEMAVAAAKIVGNGMLTTDNLNIELQNAFNNKEEVVETEEGWLYEASRVYKILNEGTISIENLTDTNAEDIFLDFNMKATQTKKLVIEVNLPSNIDINHIIVKDPINNNIIRYDKSDIEDSKIEIESNIDEEKSVIVYYKGNYYIYNLRIDYEKIAQENQRITGLEDGIYAYGANRICYYKHLSGDYTFSNGNWGDPIGGIVKYGYKLNLETNKDKELGKNEFFKETYMHEINVKEYQNNYLSVSINGSFFERIDSVNVYKNNVFSKTGIVNDNKFTVNENFEENETVTLEYVFFDGFKYKNRIRINTIENQEQKIANENETISTNGNCYYVKYGANNNWIYNWICGAKFLVNNSNMGGDPIPGTVKNLYLLKTIEIIEVTD